MRDTMTAGAPKESSQGSTEWRWVNMADSARLGPSEASMVGVRPRMTSDVDSICSADGDVFCRMQSSARVHFHSYVLLGAGFQ